MSFIDGMLVNLGVFLLYGTPLFVFLIKDLINGLRDLLKYHYVLGFSSLFYCVMLYVYFPGWFAFTVYFFMFNLVFFTLDRVILDRSRSFMLSIYICYSISVLWEWPIQLVYPQNPDALILSFFKASAIPLYFLTIKKMGWRPNRFFLKVVCLILALGVVLTICLSMGLHPSFIHFYRVPWLFIMVLCVLGSNREYLNNLRDYVDNRPWG